MIVLTMVLTVPKKYSCLAYRNSKIRIGYRAHVQCILALFCNGRPQACNPKANPKCKQGGTQLLNTSLFSTARPKSKIDARYALCLIGIVRRGAQLLAAIATVVGDDVVDVHVLGVEEDKLAVAHDILAQLGDQ
jgi:hypothetical protein